ncbi:hypothetical protein, partial [Algoriphagus sp.]
MKLNQSLLLVIFYLSFTLPNFAQDSMPPILHWDGKSKELLVDKSNKWATPFELSDGLESPTYTETMAWLEKLSA